MIILSKKQILNLHSQLINKFGGIDGVRDEGLLESPLNSLEYPLIKNEILTIF